MQGFSALPFVDGSWLLKTEPALHVLHGQATLGAQPDDVFPCGGHVDDGESVDALTRLFRDWNDLDFLEEFFTKNSGDLASYFRITDIDLAIYDTLEDANELRCVILDISPDTDVDRLFRHLENSRIAEMLLGREKARGRRRAHDSWLRIYALKLERNTYLITGGAIKLTRTMEEREHTLAELRKMEKVRNFLIEQGAVDIDGLKDIANDGKSN